jgi:hypothetical protein
MFNTSLSTTLVSASRETVLKQPLICDLHNPKFRPDTSISYSVDVDKDQRFNSHCGPGEWVVCNCITERDDYVRLDQVENNIESEETNEPIGISTVVPKLEGFATLNVGAIALNEMFLNFMTAGFTEDQALTLLARIVTNLNSPSPS